MQPDLFNPIDDATAINKIQLLMLLRKEGVRSTKLLNAFEQIEREHFVAKIFASRAYEDVALPIAAGQTLNAPSIVAKMLDSLDLQPHHMVLEVGTGSGYQAAIIAQLVKRLFTIELNRPLREEAKNRLTQYENVVSLLGNGCNGWADAAPYDRIIVTGSLKAVSSALLTQLAENGVMIIPIGAPASQQKLLKISRIGANYLTTTIAEGTFDPLVEE
jgi:protein-L-isoaspartate(D-aspartate) O-methyltransferase